MFLRLPRMVQEQSIRISKGCMLNFRRAKHVNETMNAAVGGVVERQHFPLASQSECFAAAFAMNSSS